MDKKTLEELLQLEKAARILCFKYENSSKNYDGSISNNMEYDKFKKINNLRNDILNEIEKRLDNEIKSV